MNINKIFDLNKIELVKYLFISFIISFLISNLLEIEHPIYISSIVLIIFFIMCQIQIKRDNKKEIKLNNEDKILDKDIKKKDKIVEHFRIIPQLCKKNIIPKKSPFEGLSKKELNDKLNYLYYATSHPFRPKSFNKWKKGKHYIMNPSNSVKHLEISKNDYPELSHDQINVRDCLNHHKSSPLSCKQKNPMILDINLEKKNIIQENFSQELFKEFQYPIFKNIPNDKTVEGIPNNISDDLCSSCIV